MRGEFRFASGLIVPNNISIAGAKAILESAFWLQSRTWFAALVSGAPATDMLEGDLTEPTIGVNGYARVALEHSQVGWPVSGSQNGQAYIESKDAVFVASGGNFNQPIQRVALLLGATPVSLRDVVSLSSPLPTELTIGPSTPLDVRTFNYRIYL